MGQIWSNYYAMWYMKTNSKLVSVSHPNRKRVIYELKMTCSPAAISGFPFTGCGSYIPGDCLKKKKIQRRSGSCT